MKSPWDRGPEPWIHITNQLPPENVVVETQSESGMEQDLILHKNLWWFDDMSMYVYYTPRLWRRKNAV